MTQVSDEANEHRRRALIQLAQAEDGYRAYWFEEAGIPARFAGITLEEFDKTLQPKAYNVIDKRKAEESLVLLSPGAYGVGKTHLVCALADRILKAGVPCKLNDADRIVPCRCPVFFTTEPAMMARIRATYNRTFDDSETEDDAFCQLINVPLLIIDDVGKVKPRDPSFLQGVYYRVIDGRYSRESPIILTTNLDAKELEEHIGGACLDRLLQMCGRTHFIKMSGKSYRRQ